MHSRYFFAAPVTVRENLQVHISLLKQIIKNFEAMAKLSDDPTCREEYKQEAEEVRKEVSDYEQRIQTLRESH